jgi:hypothetical protein
MLYNDTEHSLCTEKPLGTKADMRLWSHMCNAFERLAAFSARPRQHAFSQVTNNEASVFHERTLIRAKMFSPHDRLPITSKTPHRDRAPLDVSCRFPWEDHDTEAADTTGHALHGGYVHCIATTHRAASPGAVGASRKVLYTQGRGGPTSARFVKSSIR